jgi:hypothetical protein
MLVFGFSAAYSQDLIKELQKLTLANDSLQKELKLARENSAKQLKVANDSITRLITVNKTNVSNLNHKIANLEGDTANLHKEIKKLDRNKMVSLETQLQQKKDSVNLLKDTIKEKKEQIVTVKNESLQRQREQYNDGQQNVYKQIGQLYQGNAFDDLVKCSTKQSVERDLQLVGTNAEAMKKLQDLQTYFAAKQALEEKYNEQEIKIAQSKISKITQSDLVKALNDKIGKYKLCNEGLKTTIGKILDLDKKFTANDDYTQTKKLQEILTELSWYFRNYRFNFTDYPYLSDLVLEIMKLKQKDANADISALFSRL